MKYMLTPKSAVWKECLRTAKSSSFIQIFSNTALKHHLFLFVS